MGTLEKSLLDRLNGWPLPETETSWGKRRQDIRNHMEKESWADFLHWPVVRASLFTGQIPNTDAELEILRGTGIYRTLEELGALPWNGTAIHQAHLLWWYGEYIPPDWKIAEFGGGYGEMYRFLHAHGHTGPYYVYDFPELLILQEYYLVTAGVPLSDWHPCYTAKQWERALGADLFVSLCALSEAPLSVRWMVDDISPKSLAVRFQPAWDGIDNKKWFFDYAEEHNMEADSTLAPAYTNHILMSMERK